MNTPISILVDNHMDLDSVGGQWLLLLLEEKQLHPEKKISPLGFYNTLIESPISFTDKGYKAMMVSCKRECDKVGKTVSNFINSAF